MKTHIKIKKLLIWHKKVMTKMMKKQKKSKERKRRKKRKPDSKLESWKGLKKEKKKKYVTSSKTTNADLVKKVKSVPFSSKTVHKIHNKRKRRLQQG